ncbi:DNA gyrase subunit A [Bradymonas sediminis]|uniref:DNA gyrase subunit A n=1 Tax=Bradymonas sediminis TaxID=1548548 RepID=A0A2Z4FQP3_9DELT|nr:DNA gyrase subunit A [Bradymonas sediminis]AWV91299.1 DNA gyrase subunit A [Bradymonas sediminis]TDP73875.1 DNA gyrase subunit A [Bradymonas sediminis]
MADESTHIIPINIEDEIRNSYLDYAMSVIIGRALPDVRDGLKPVHRRILYGQYELGNRWNSAYKKSARIVGEVMGKFHPHGDSSIYDALVRMAQDFNMRMPLVDGQGNFGSIDGDSAAAMRYTEVRMDRVAEELLSDIDKDTIDWVDNYDGNEKEPSVLPARLPNLLINGSSGIAVGMSTNIPPHNPTEVIAAAVALVDNPKISVDELMQIVPGPDFPTAGLIYGASGIRDAYTTGRGVIRMRARVDIEYNEKNGKSSLITTELPYQVNKARLIEKIAHLVRDKKIDGITDIRDESDRKGMRMVIELRRDVIPEIVLNNLFKMTQMQASFGIITRAIVNGQAKVMGLKEVLMHFVDFRRDIVTRRTIFELGKAEARAHILEGLKIALDNLDEVIALIRASASPAEAHAGLMEKFALSELQADAILRMRLQKLTGLERDKILAELAELRATIEYLKSILGDESVLMGVIRDELVEAGEINASERRTEILYNVSHLSVEDLIAEEDVVVTLSHQGYIKRTPLDEYRAQRRGGRGKRGMATKDEDFVTDMFVASTHTNILIFTSVGKLYLLRTHELPQGSRTTRGSHVANVLPLESDEVVRTILAADDFYDDKFLVFATRNGLVKKTRLDAYQNVHSGGIIALNIKDGDRLVSVRLTDGSEEILLVSQNGQAIRFHEEDVRAVGRNASGVIGMRFRDDDELVGMEVVPKDAPEGEETADEPQTLLAITENGYGKRTVISEYPIRGRGGLGVITMKVNDRNGKLVGIRLVSEDDQLILITDHGQVLRTRVGEISTYGRNTQGVKVMVTDPEETVVSMARLPEGEEDEDEDEDEIGEDGLALEGADGEVAPDGDADDAQDDASDDEDA